MTQPGGEEPFGKVEVDVVPNARGFAAAVKRDLDTEATAAGEQLGRRMAAPIGRQVSSSVISGLKGAQRDIPAQADKMGRDFGDRFGHTMGDGISKALKGLPKITLTADSTDVDKKAAHIRKELEDLGGKRIGVDISADEAVAKLQLLRGQASSLAREIEKLKTEHPDVKIDTNAVAVMAQLTAVHAELRGLAKEHATPKVEPQVDAGAFAARLRAALDAANKALPDIRPGVDASPIDEAVAAIKVKIASIRDLHIRGDLDDTAAKAKIAELLAELEVLKRSAHANLKFDIGEAQAKIAGVNAELEGTAVSAGAAAGGMKLVDFAASGAAIKMGAMVAVGGLIAALLVPALAAVVPILGAIAVGAAVAFGAAAVLLAGIAPMVAAYMAMGKAQTKSGQAAQKSVQSAQAIADAERNLARTKVSAARQIEAADQSVADARRNVGEVAKRVAADEQAAAQRTRDAYTAVRQATLDVAAAQKAVNDARDQARRDEEDLASQIAHNAEDQRQNALDLAAAQKDLNSVLANPASTKAQREQAQLNYDRLSTQNGDLQTQAQRLAQAKAKQDKQGIEGSDLVVAAKKAELKAEQDLADRRAAYAKAQADQVTVAQDGATKIADAQRALAKSESDAAYQRVQAAQSVADAQRAVTRAQQQQNTAIAGTGSAADDAAKKLAKLSPAAASLVKYLKGLDLGPLLRAAQGFAGPLEAGLKRFLPTMLPILTTFATQVSAAIGGAMGSLLTEFSSPFWQDFLTWLAGITAQALPGFAKALGYAARTVAGLLEAFGPIAGTVGQGFLDILQKVAIWATNLGQSKGFHDFLAYAMAQIPKVAALLKAMWGAVKNVIVALAPIGEWALGFFTKLFDYIAGMDTGTLTTILGLLIAGAAAIAGLASVAKVIQTVSKISSAFGQVGDGIKIVLTRLGLMPAAQTAAAIGADTLAVSQGAAAVATDELAVSEGVAAVGADGLAASEGVAEAATVGLTGALAVLTSPITGIIVAIVAVVAAIVILYKKNQWFHDFVDRTWKAIAGFFVTAWNQYIWPALKAIGDFITGTLVPILLWLWRNVFIPVFQGIWTVIQLWWAGVQIYLQLVWAFITTVLAPIFLWLWHNVIEPAFAGIWAAIQVAWTVIQVVFQAIWTFITTVLAPIFEWLWHNVIEPAWQGIQVAIGIAWGIIRVIFGIFVIAVVVLGRIFGWLWHTIIEPAFKGIWGTIQWAWGLISGIFSTIWTYLKTTLGPVFTWLYENAIKPAWDKIWTTINTVWGWIQGVFDKLGNYVSKTVKPLFEDGVKAIGKVWEGLEELMKAPVRFVVNTVIDDGIIDTLNKVAGFLKITGFGFPIPRISLPKTFATGGPVHGPGTSTSDSILARLSDDEHVWTAAEVAAIGGHENMLKLRRAALAGRLSELAGFAAGGAVRARPRTGADGLPAYKDGGGVFGWIGNKIKGVAGVVADFAKAAFDAVRDPKKFLTDLSNKLVAQIPFQDSTWFKLMAGIPQRITDTAVGWLKNVVGGYKSTPGDTKPWTGTLSPDPLLKSMQQWALGQQGKTYLWTAVGPDRYDCSGLVGNLWGLATGNSLYKRYFTTSGMGAGKFGMAAGPGRFTVYLKRGSHTAANIDGLHAEAYHGNGTPLAIGHVGTKLSYYDEILHLPGLAAGGPARGSTILDASKDERLKAFLAYGWPEPPMSFDAGGLLPDTRGLPGGVMPVYHGSSAPDAVLTDQQFTDMHALARQAGAGARGGLNIENYHEHGADAAVVARDLDWLARGLG